MAGAVPLDADALAGLARALAPDLRAGDAILLEGEVGAGKSHFARALVQARQFPAPEDVPSPSFTLVQTYLDPRGTEIWHADLYRLSDGAELDELGLTDALDEAICLIEWPSRMADAPETALHLGLAAHDNPDLRNLRLSGGARLVGMADRAWQRADFVARAGWGAAAVTMLAGDASDRRYYRLHGPDATAVLMDAPPNSTGTFLRMARWLTAHGFAAPSILAADEAAGLILLEDLGDRLVARAVEAAPEIAVAVYEQIARELAALHRHTPPEGLVALDGAALAEQVELFESCYLAATGQQGAARGLGGAITRAYDRLCADVGLVTALRDFHAENILLCDDGRLGLLDFQDAVAAHPAYDLASVLHDARRVIAPEVQEAAIAAYLAESGAEPVRFRAAFALLGLARNLRIMGIFTRLCQRDGKPRYLDFMPHLWSLIEAEARHPELAELAAILAPVQGPTPDLIERIKETCPTV